MSEETEPGAIDLRRPAIGFGLTVLGAMVAGVLRGGPVLDLLPFAMVLGVLFAGGMWAAQLVTGD